MWFADFVEKNPEKAMQLGDPENIQLVTGDDVFDKIEAKIAKGEKVHQDELLHSFLDEEGVAEVKNMFRHQKQEDDQFMDFVGEHMNDKEMHKRQSHDNTQFEF